MFARMPSHNIEAHIDDLERFSRIKHRDIHEEQDLRHDDSAGYLHGGEKRQSWFEILDWGKNTGPGHKAFQQMPAISGKYLQWIKHKKFLQLC